jgi:hypothetical protein
MSIQSVACLKNKRKLGGGNLTFAVDGFEYPVPDDLVVGLHVFGGSQSPSPNSPDASL